MGRGRPSKAKEWLTKESLDQIELWAAEGLSEGSVAEQMGVHPSTLVEWKKKYPNLSNALKNGQDKHTAKKIRACNKGTEELLVGHYVDEQITEITEHPDGSQTRHIKNSHRWVDANATMIIFEKKHLMPEVYGDKVLPNMPESGKEMDGLSASLMELAKELNGND